MLALSFLVLPLLSDPAALQATPEGPLPPAAQDAVTSVATAEPAAAPAEPPTNDPAAVPETTPAAMPDVQIPKKEWMLVIAPGFDYIRGPSSNPYTALGGGARFGGHAVKWGGGKGKFFIGGGPILHYSYIKDQDFDDVIHLITLNGDLLIGGGGPGVWAVYGHLTGGLGYFSGFDAQSGLRIQTIGARGALGVGGFGKITDRFSLGGLVDFGWAGGLWVNALITANIHFGRGGQEL